MAEAASEKGAERGVGTGVWVWAAALAAMVAATKMTRNCSCMTGITAPFQAFGENDWAPRDSPIGGDRRSYRSFSPRSVFFVSPATAVLDEVNQEALIQNSCVGQ